VDTKPRHKKQAVKPKRPKPSPALPRPSRGAAAKWRSELKQFAPWHCFGIGELAAMLRTSPTQVTNLRSEGMPMVATPEADGLPCVVADPFAVCEWYSARGGKGRLGKDLGQVELEKLLTEERVLKLRIDREEKERHLVQAAPALGAVRRICELMVSHLRSQPDQMPLLDAARTMDERRELVRSGNNRLIDTLRAEVEILGRSGDDSKAG